MRGISRRQANLDQCSEDLVGRSSDHLDRGRGHVHILTIEALHGKFGEAKVVEEASDHDIFGCIFSGYLENVLPNLESDVGGVVLDGHIGAK